MPKPRTQSGEKNLISQRLIELLGESYSPNLLKSPGRSCATYPFSHKKNGMKDSLFSHTSYLFLI
nr:hypothetical protein [uncultured Blautia sp.]